MISDNPPEMAKEPEDRFQIMKSAHSDKENKKILEKIDKIFSSNPILESSLESGKISPAKIREKKDFFEVVINDQYRVTLKKVGTEEGFGERFETSELVLIEKLKTSSISKSLSHFFRGVLAFFYKPYLEIAQPKLSFDERTHSNFQELTRALECGKKWIESTADIDPKTGKEIESAITHGRQITSILKKPSSERREALENLSSKYALEIAALGDKESIVIPTGYQTERGMQPLFLRFTKENDQILLTIYNDQSSSMQVCEEINHTFPPEADDSSFKNVLSAFFSPLVEPQKSEFKGSTKGIEVFHRLFEDQKKTKARELGIPLTQTETHEEPQVASKRILEEISFQSLLTSAGIETKRSDTGKMARSQNAPECALNWLTHIGASGEDNLSLLYRLTEDWISSTTKKIDFLPKEEQKAVIQDCLDQLDYVSKNIAVRISGDSTEKTALPEALLKRKDSLEKRLEEITKEQKKELAEVANRILESKADFVVSIPLPETPKITTETALAVEEINTGLSTNSLSEADKVINRLEEAFSAENQKVMASSFQWSRISPADRIALAPVMNQEGKESEKVEALFELLLERNGHFNILWERSAGHLAPMTIDEAKVMLKAFILENRSPDTLQLFERVNGSSDTNRAVLSLLLAPLHPNYICPNPTQKVAVDALRSFFGMRALIHEKAMPDLEQNGVEKLTVSVLTTLHSTLESIQHLQAEASKTDNIIAKKLLLEKSREMAFTLLQTLPPASPAVMKSTQAPLWATCSSKQRKEMLTILANVEKSIFQTNLQLSCQSLPPQEMLFLYKAQSIRFSLIRKDINETTNKLEKAVIESLDKGNDLESLGLDFLAVKIKGSLQFHWNMGVDVENHLSLSKFIDKNNIDVDLSLFMLNSFTPNYNSINSFLTQDCSSLLSSSTRYEEELLSLQHCMTDRYERAVGGYKGGLLIDLDYETNRKKKNPLIYPEVGEDGKSKFSLLVSKEFSDLRDKMGFRFDESLRECVHSIFYIEAQKQADFAIKEMDNPSELPFFSLSPNIFLKTTAIDIELQPDPENASVLVPAIIAKTNGSRKEYALDFAAAGPVIQKETRNKLPTLGYRDSPSNYGREQRVVVGGDELVTHVFEEASKGAQQLPPDVLSILCLIRVASSTVENTSYSPVTALNALHFMTDERYTEYLHLESVQKFLEESLFSPMLIQSLLQNPSYTSAVPTHLRSLHKAIQQAEKNQDWQLLAFLSSTKERLQAHLELAHSSVEQDGVWSPFALSILPPPKAQDALTMRIDQYRNYLKSCLDESKAIPLKNFAAALDIKQTDEEMKLLTRNILLCYAGKELSPAQKQIALSCYRDFLMTAENDPVAIDLNRWITQIAHSLKGQEKEAILNDLWKQKNPKKDLPDGAKWVEDAQIPLLFRLERNGQQLFSVSLIGKNSGSGDSTRPVAIPRDILNRAEVRQALGTDLKIVAVKTKAGDREEYRWKDATDQQFCITVIKDTCVITRIMDKEQYQFVPIAQGPFSPAELLLNTHGIWRKGSDDFVFTSGVKKPLLREQFAIEKSQNTITAIKSVETGFFISSDSSLLRSSLFSAIDQKQLLILVDAKKQPQEIQLQGMSLSFKRSDEEWIAFEGSQKIGVMDLKELQGATTRFGPFAHQYMIPLKQADGQYSYLVFPKAAQRDGQEFHCKNEKVAPFVMKTNKQGELEASAPCFFYLAQMALLQADAAGGKVTRDELYAAVLGYINQAKLEPHIPQDQLESLTKINAMIDSYANKKMDFLDQKSLCLLIKMKLAIREMVKVPPEKQFDDNVLLVTLETLYKSKKQPDSFTLLPDEEKSLEECAKITLRNLSTQMSSQPGRKEYDISMDLPRELSPELMLMLLRSAKDPKNVHEDVRKLCGPLYANHLLENFWGYAKQIYSDPTLDPQTLSFLFQPCLIPETKNPETQEMLQKTETEARQFLLALSTLTQLQKEAGLAMSKINDFKSDFLKTIDLPFISALEKAELTSAAASAREIQQLVSKLPVDKGIKELFPKMRDLQHAIEQFHKEIEKDVTKKTQLKEKLQECHTKCSQENKVTPEIQAFFEKEVVPLLGTSDNAMSLQQLVKEGSDTRPLQLALKQSQQEVAVAIEQSSKMLEKAKEFSATFAKEFEKIEGGSNKLTLLESIKPIMDVFFDGTTEIRPFHTLALPSEKSLPALMPILSKEKKPDFSTVQQLGIKETISILANKKELEAFVEQAKIYASPLAILSHVYEAVEKGKVIYREAPSGKATFSLKEQQELKIELEKHSHIFTKEERDEILERAKAMTTEEAGKYIDLLKRLLKKPDIARQLAYTNNCTKIESLSKEEPKIGTKSSPALLNAGDIQHLSRSPFELTEKEFFTLTADNSLTAKNQAIKDSLNKVLPGSPSAYKDDLEKGIEQFTPGELKSAVEPKKVTSLTKQLEQELSDCRAGVETSRGKILSDVKNIALKDLPESLRLLKLKGESVSDQELLEEACKVYRKGVFATKHPELDAVISTYLLQSLRAEQQQKAVDQAKVLQPLVKEMSGPNKERAELEFRLESNKLRELLDRCQDFSIYGSEKFGKEYPKLVPHVRKLYYLQYRTGLVLRPEQLQAIQEILTDPSMLKELRMGLGKTSMIFPVVLDALADEGIFPIGMLPKAIFNSNFDEMDAMTRLAFELCGNRLEFTREDASMPLSEATLLALSQKSLAVFEARKKGEYVLTTIEAKASIDDKIIEIEKSEKKLFLQYKVLLDKKEPLSHEDKRLKEGIYSDLSRCEQALDMLYTLQGVFKQPKTRLIVDEADQVARANYSVNSEIGGKKAPDSRLQLVANSIFSHIQSDSDLKELREAIETNTQFSDPAKHSGWLKLVAEKSIDKTILGRVTNETGCSEEAVIKWVLGGASPFTPETLAKLTDSDKVELKMFRKAINSSLRGALALKVGLNCDADAIHGIVGVPASQGVVSPTTKYQDPLMQLMLTNMIALYKPATSSFIASAVPDTLYKLPQGEARKNLSQLQDNSKLDPVFDWQKALQGSEPWKQVVRLEMAKIASERQYISVSDSQATRPVQHAIRDCQVTGLTGTATRNLSPVIANTKSIDEKGRAVTAEVVFRIATSSDNGLDTVLKTYPSDSKKAFEQSVDIAKQKDTQGKFAYDLIVDQANIADNIKTLDKIVAIAAESNRPVIAIDPESGKKMVFFPNKTKLALDQAKELKNPFYYYDPARVRGTDFVIPVGSKGVVFLTPDVNASDRDQAVSRMRKLGDGHFLELRISEQQKVKIKPDGSDVRLSDLLQVHHEQTAEDEKSEYFTATIDSIRGVLDSSCEKIKQQLQEQTAFRSKVDWEKNQSEIEQNLANKLTVTSVFEERFLENTSNEKYLEQLDGELLSQGRPDSKSFVIAAIDNEIKECDKFIKTLRQPEVIKLLEAAKAALLAKKTDFEKNWDKDYAKLMPKGGEKKEAISETEVEAEQEAQQESESESSAISKGNPSKEIDFSAISGQNKILDQRITIPDILAMAGKNEESIPFGRIEECWSPSVQASIPILNMLENFRGTRLPPIGLLITTQKDSQPIITAMLPSQIHNDLFANSFFTEEANIKKPQIKEFSCSSVVGTMVNGELQFISHFAPAGSPKQEIKDHGRLLLTYLYLGHTLFSENNWKEMKKSVEAMSPEEQKSFSIKLEENLKSRNVLFLEEAKSKLK